MFAQINRSFSCTRVENVVSTPITSSFSREMRKVHFVIRHGITLKQSKYKLDSIK